MFVLHRFSERTEEVRSGVFDLAEAEALVSIDYYWDDKLINFEG